MYVRVRLQIVMAKRISGGTPLRQVALAKKRRAAEQKEARDKVTALSLALQQ